MGFPIALFSLNQWALDFSGNVSRILESIEMARDAGAVYRAGPELELCGYSSEDAFYEQDTIYHSWVGLLKIIEHSRNLDMIIDVGMPVQNSDLYNCRVIVFKGKILCIRAKTSLAKEGNYREFRHFTPWSNSKGMTAYLLPKFVALKVQQSHVPFGSNFILELGLPGECDSFKIGWEICQELWDIKNVSSHLFQHFGCHLIVNSSASYWELRKLDTVLHIIKGISLRGGGCYAFSNGVGCDGQRYVFYGRSCIYDKGQIVAMSSTSSEIFQSIQMVTYTIFPKDINEYRSQMCIRIEGSKGRTWNLLNPSKEVSQIDSSIDKLYLNVSFPSAPRVITHTLDMAVSFQREIHLYVPLWLWDYLRRSSMKGFMIPLSGGLDSSSVAILVYSMCTHLLKNFAEKEVQEYFTQVHNIRSENLKDCLDSPKKICNLLLKCCYLSTRYSSQQTRRRAATLSQCIGADFSDVSLQDIYTLFRGLLAGQDSDEVGLLDQNLQARLRMAATYYLSSGCRIVLATGNVDESIMGYLTKYDCSFADINPIGGLCKDDLKSYLNYCRSDVFKSDEKLADILLEIINAPPSAELTGAEQRDEDEMGITYDEISVLGKIRRGIYGCNGPRGAFERIWSSRYSEPFCSKIRCLKVEDSSVDLGETASKLAELIKRFYQRYARNRHKLTVLTPALHAETYSPDDNRFDHRHFLYAPQIEQFKCIDSMVDEIKLGGRLSIESTRSD